MSEAATIPAHPSASPPDAPASSGAPPAAAPAPPDASAWEAAYLRFETSEQEIRKFTGRLRRLGARDWPRDARIVELFCGRGNGLVALERLGFTRLEGADISPALLARYRGPAALVEADCRRLPFPDRSRDIVIVQGGLHHLESLERELDSTLSEMRRVLRPAGLAVIVEPWWTPFLGLVHLACSSRRLRRLWPRLDALSVMIEHEKATYERWLESGDEILRALSRHFSTRRLRIGRGKLLFTGAPRIDG